jgi:hypothetical protein
MKEDELNKLKGDDSVSKVKIIDPPLQKKIKKKLPAKMTLGESSESNSEEEKTELFQNFKMKTNIEVRQPIKAGDNPDTQEEELKAIDAKLKELKALNLAKNIKLSFFYFDGFKQVKSVTVPKSTKVGEFLELARKFICQEYPEFSGIKGDHIFQLVIDEYLIPNDVTFSDLELKTINHRAGPDIRFKRSEAEDAEELISKSLKIIDRRFYEQNRHVFPFNKWIHLPL